MLQTVIDWAKKNWIVSILIGIFLLFIMGGRKVKNLIMPAPRRRRRRVAPVRRTRTRVNTRRRPRVNRKPLPRSVGTSRRGYPKAGGGIIPFKRNKDGTIKKAWQVAGTAAAKSRMRRLRNAR